ncbi:hypothetical protein AB0M36_16870 [Actinoplanes sp. NPDC051346]|uniref:hypothetical protein n=1 Tax=Actinoplanes sp. NPDC051346 TaxID=3155048 RepID=UPI00342FEAA3
MTSVDTQYRDKGIGAPGEQRREFVRAFSEYGWARPGAERPAARPHVTLIVATVATLIALLAGVAMQLIKPVKLKKPVAPAPPKAVTTYSAVSGWDCGVFDDHGFAAEGRQSTWVTVGEGGWTRDGCHGDYVVIPFAGAGSVTPASVQWWFRPPTAMKNCTVQVFVPTPDGSVFKPVPSVTYSVLNARGGTEFARFSVRQAGSAGTWVTGGAYPVTKSGIAVRITSAGKAPFHKAMLAVGQLKVSCTG